MLTYILLASGGLIIANVARAWGLLPEPEAPAPPVTECSWCGIRFHESACGWPCQRCGSRIVTR